jgi:hypothetical protein
MNPPLGVARFFEIFRDITRLVHASTDVHEVLGLMVWKVTEAFQHFWRNNLQNLIPETEHEIVVPGRQPVCRQQQPMSLPSVGFAVRHCRDFFSPCKETEKMSPISTREFRHSKKTATTNLQHNNCRLFWGDVWVP